MLANKQEPIADQDLFWPTPEPLPKISERRWVLEGAAIPLPLEELGLGTICLEPIQSTESAANSLVALEELFVSQRRRLKSFIRRRLSDENAAEDIVQQTFLGAYRSWSSFRGESTPETWLFGIAMNLIRDLTSRSPSARIKFAPEEEIEEEASPELDPMHICMRAQFGDRLSRAVENLPKDMADTLRLVAEDGLSYQQAADALGVPIGTVRSRLSRARAALKGLLDKYLE